MNIYEEIQKELRKEWQNGTTQQEMADKYKTTNPHINRLINDIEKVKKIGLQTLLNIFPTATINLHGDNTITQHHNNGVTVGVNHGTVGADNLAQVLDQIMECDKIDPASKIEVYNIIKKSM